MISKLNYLFIESSINSIGIWGRSCEVDGGGDAGDELGGGGMRGGEAGDELGGVAVCAVESSAGQGWSFLRARNKNCAGISAKWRRKKLSNIFTLNWLCRMKNPTSSKCSNCSRNFLARWSDFSAVKMARISSGVNFNYNTRGHSHVPIKKWKGWKEEG